MIDITPAVPLVSETVSYLRRIWAYEISFFVRNPKLG